MKYVVHSDFRHAATARLDAAQRSSPKRGEDDVMDDPPTPSQAFAPALPSTPMGGGSRRPENEQSAGTEGWQEQQEGEGLDAAPHCCFLLPGMWLRQLLQRGASAAAPVEDPESEPRLWREKTKLASPAKRVDSYGRPLLEEGEEDGASGRCYLTVREVEARMIRDGFCWYIARSPDCEEKRILYYLYGREFGWKLPRGERRVRIRRFVANAGTVARMNRVLACVVGGSVSAAEDSASDPTRANRCLWRKMQETIMCYREFYETCMYPVSTIFCQNSKNNIFPYIMILQESKACYITASATLVNYKVAMSKIPETGKTAATEEFSEAEAKEIATVEPVDTSRYIRHRFSNDDLERRVVGNEGGSSRLVLQDLLGYGDNKGFIEYKIPDCDTAEHEAVSRQVVEALNKYGPALLPCFDMTSILSLRGSNQDRVHKTVVYMPTFDVKKGVDGNEVDALEYKRIGFYEDEGAEARATKIDFFEDVNATRGTNKENSLASSGSNELDDSQPQAIASSSSSNSLVQSENEEAAEIPAAHHAMVVIGSRFDGMKNWFLVQNSWRTMPLLEMSDAFLAKYQGDNLVFVTRRVSAAALKGVLSSRSCVFYECAIGDDGGDKKVEALEDGLVGSTSSCPGANS